MDRRSWLKTFGVGTAAVVTELDSKGSPTIETVTEPEPLKRGVSVRPPYFHDVQRGRLYSGVETESFWDGPLEFFRDPIGMVPPDWNRQNIRPPRRLTVTDTNMVMGSTLPVPTAFCVEKIGVVFGANCERCAVRDFVADHVLEFWIFEKLYWRSPLSEMFQESFIADLDKDGRELLNPNDLVRYIDLGNVPFILSHGVQFHAAIVGPGNSKMDYLRLWVCLDGLHARAVQ